MSTNTPTIEDNQAMPNLSEPTQLSQPQTGTDALGQPATLDQPVLGQPSTDQPSTDQPVLGQPATLDQPTFGQPDQPTTLVTDQPVLGQPATLDQPSTDQPAFGQPDQPTTLVTDQPAFGQTDQPAFGQTDQPSTDQPAFGQTDQPSTDQPAFGQTDQPETEQQSFGQTDQPETEQPAFGQTESKDITITIDKSTLVSLSQNLNSNLLVTISAYKSVLGKLTEIVTNPDKQTKINDNIEMLNGIEKSVTELLGNVQENLDIPQDKIINASKILEDANKGNNSFINTALQIDAATILAFLGSAIAMAGGKKTKRRHRIFRKKSKRHKPTNK
jgi:hypothetical protein